VGRAPELARFYPCLGGAPVWPDTADAFVGALERHAEEIRPRLDEQVKTNEVRRCAGLLGESRVPLRREAHAGLARALRPQ
jgi:hypothetical protein